MTLVFLFTLAIGNVWAIDIPVSFVDGYTTNYDVSTNVTGFGNVYFGSRTNVSKNTPSYHTNYRTPKGNFVYELTSAAKIDVVFYSTSSRTVSIGLYTMDSTTYSVWQNAAGSSSTMLAWLISNKNLK
ncbi:MAG: hypothetical protein J6P84_00235, partial [Alphaproteobacteria bacterium]|nr:hypothetical protein [Alphaproteobacteria bacterium]